MSAQATEASDPNLSALLGRLLGDAVSYFPVRHHSPACAWHLEALIERLRPASILIEGPASFDRLIPVLVHPETRPPVAIYTHFVDRKLVTLPAALRPDQAKIGPARYAAYYPFCDYTPELVALRKGGAQGARVRFIDLDFHEQVLQEVRHRGSAARVGTLMRERNVQHSAYVQELARRRGCRDHNELWDDLFESDFKDVSTETFIHRVATYCYYSRQGATDEVLDADATRQREERMLAHIQAELHSLGTDSLDGPVLVVTGGYHTVALATAEHEAASPSTAAEPDSLQQAVIRYSFHQLDSVNGYGAGMPAPSYYQTQWERRHHGEALQDAALELVVALGRRTRKMDLPSPLSAADEIAALHHASCLGEFRGHPGPLREDLLDGIRSCCVNGSLDTEGSLIMRLAHELMTGNRVGEVAKAAGTPPLIVDLQRRCRELRLTFDQLSAKESSLDLYRRRSHRRASRLFHSLALLNVPFARLQAGPDFVRGSQLDRMQEVWSYHWSPQTERSLIEASVYGSTIEEATMNRLNELITTLDEAGAGRSAEVAVGLLVEACRVGLQRHAVEVLPKIQECIAEEPHFAPCARAVAQLAALWSAREPLEAHRLPAIPILAEAAYLRACHLAESLSRCPQEYQAEVLDALTSLREQLVGELGESVDPEVFWEVLERLDGQPGTEAMVAGAVCGLLHLDGRLSEAELERRTEGQLLGAGGDWSQRVAFLKGLFRTCRELSWQNRKLMGAIDALIYQLDESSFLAALPELRLAFSGHTPRETDRTAALVCELHGAGSIGELVNRELDQAELAHNLEIARRVAKSLQEDGLLGLLGASSKKKADPPKGGRTALKGGVPE